MTKQEARDLLASVEYSCGTSSRIEALERAVRAILEDKIREGDK